MKERETSGGVSFSGRRLFLPFEGNRGSCCPLISLFCSLFHPFHPFNVFVLTLLFNSLTDHHTGRDVREDTRDGSCYQINPWTHEKHRDSRKKEISTIYSSQVSKLFEGRPEVIGGFGVGGHEEVCL